MEHIGVAPSSRVYFLVYKLTKNHYDDPYRISKTLDTSDFTNSSNLLYFCLVRTHLPQFGRLFWVALTTFQASKTSDERFGKTMRTHFLRKLCGGVGSTKTVLLPLTKVCVALLQQEALFSEQNTNLLLSFEPFAFSLSNLTEPETKNYLL